MTGPAAVPGSPVDAPLRESTIDRVVDTSTLGYAARTGLTSHYVRFSGRARRAEYWWFTVVYMVAAAVAVALCLVVGAAWPLVLLLPVIPPMLAVSIRRMHDMGRSGRWMLIALVPVVGPVIYLAMMTRPGEPTANRFGPPTVHQVR